MEPAGKNHYITLKFVPFYQIYPAGPAMPEAIAFLQITHLLLVCLAYL